MHWLVVAGLLAANPDPSVPGEGSSQRPEDAKSSGAQPTPEERRKLEEEIAKEMGAQPQTTAPGQPAGAAGQPAAPQAEPGQLGGSPFARLLLLPDISAVGSAALAWNRLDVEALSPRSDPFAPAHTLQPIFQELELGLQAVVDPYARADVFLAFSEEGAEVEEAYLTTLGLPLGLQVRAGKLFAPFGRLNQQHPHMFDFVDRPLALARLLAVESLGGPGLDVAWLAPTPWFAELHLGYQALTPGFEESSRNAGVARLAQFFDVGEASTLGVGVSAARMDEGRDAWRDLLGGDLYLKLRSPRSRTYLALQGELVAQRLSGLAAAEAEGEEPAADPNGTEWGAYVQALWRQSQSFAYGARYERAPAAAGGPENRVSALATWLPSEFQRLRLQLSYDRLPGGQDGLEALLHVEFSIGAHGAHPF